MVTVIITTYGGDPRLSRAIKSVLNQSYNDIQLIVVDDNNPGTKGRIATEEQMIAFECEERVEYIKHEKNKNAAVARNTGINVAKGKYLCFLDDDDYFLKEHIKLSVECCEENKNCVGIACNVAIITAGMLSDIYVADKDAMRLDRILKTHNIGTGSNLFLKADTVRCIHGFDEEFIRNQDIEFIIRILKHGTILCQNRTSIVKDISSSRKLDYYKLKSSYARFDDKFKDILSEFPKSFQKDYFAERVHSLLATAKISGEQEAYDDAVQAVMDIDSLSKAELADIKQKKRILGVRQFINRLKYGKGVAIFNVFMKLRNTIPHLKYKKQLGYAKYKEIYAIYSRK